MEKAKKALITGITGQDGYFLLKLLQSKGYEVHGVVRHSIHRELGNLKHLSNREFYFLKLHYGDITDSGFISKLFQEHQYDECYHLAAQSFVAYSFKNPSSTYDININGTLNILEAIRNFSPKTRVYFAGTSELYGKVHETPQTEQTPFHPRSPYGISKLAGFWTVKHYREAYNIFGCSGILFNHESEYRGNEFVTQKIIKHIARNELNNDNKVLQLGNLNAKRDWGYAKNYVYGMYLMLQQNKPNDYVLATGQTNSIRDFVNYCYEAVGKKVTWKDGRLLTDEKGYVGDTLVVEVSEEYYRPCEVDLLLGDYTKAKKKLKWKPKTELKELIEIMMSHALNEAD